MTESFDRLVYAAVRAIPRGRVSTYGRIAEQCGSPRAARAVGMALHRNPQPGVIPCHRVVNRVGRLAPAFAFGGEEEQRRLLEAEGVPFTPEGLVDMAKCLYSGSNLPEQDERAQDDLERNDHNNEK